ncbi:MAG: hypothetical protein F6J87_16900 [Spirulina sp. SIO3F2]|nr:hypothetical protein [Spirulina sp. SIO3F2]
MRRVFYSAIFPDDSRETINDCDLVDFLLEIPSLLDFGFIPPLKVMNLLLLSGEMDAGMGHALEWEAFQLSEDEYSALVDALLEQSSGNLSTDGNFQHIEDFEEWTVSIFIKHYKGNDEMLKIVENYHQGKFSHTRY